MLQEKTGALLKEFGAIDTKGLIFGKVNCVNKYALHGSHEGLSVYETILLPPGGKIAVPGRKEREGYESYTVMILGKRPLPGTHLSGVPGPRIWEDMPETKKEYGYHGKGIVTLHRVMEYDPQTMWQSIAGNRIWQLVKSGGMAAQNDKEQETLTLARQLTSVPKEDMELKRFDLETINEDRAFYGMQPIDEKGGMITQPIEELSR